MKSLVMSVPSLGDVMETVGGLVSLETVTGTEAVAVLPAASEACAVIVELPLGYFVVSQANTGVATLLVPIKFPLIEHVTLVTPTLSVAETWTWTVPETVVEGFGFKTVILGGVVIYFAYNFYARRIDRSIIQANAGKATPAKMYMDGVDFMPASRNVLYGYHFKSIAAAGDRKSVV